MFDNLAVDLRQSTPKSRFNFAKAVRKLMRGSSMPKSRGIDTDPFFDHFKVTVSQAGMTYYQSYDIYLQYARGTGHVTRENANIPPDPVISTIGKNFINTSPRLPKFTQA